MTRDDWLAVLASKPVTVRQRGRLMHECERLGLTDRGERLTVLAELLGIERLDSTADLTQGQGGYLVGVLTDTRDRAELPDVDDGQADDGLTDHCGCCGHSRDSGCGGPSCPCGVAADDGGDQGGTGPVTLADVLGQLGRLLYALMSPDARSCQSLAGK